MWLSSMFNPADFAAVGKLPRELGVAIGSAVALLAVEWLNRREPFGFARLPGPRPVRWLLYYAVMVVVVVCAPGSETFVYFQF